MTQWPCVTPHVTMTSCSFLIGQCSLEGKTNCDAVFSVSVCTLLLILLKMNTQANEVFLDIKECESDNKITSTLQMFTMAQIVSYFIEAFSSDKERKNDFKSLRESSFQMFKEGHIQKILLKGGYGTIIIKCQCLPEMRKDRVYNIMVRLNNTNADIQFAKCDCVAGSYR